jgi:beta-barrel assembly-enhancing protease
MKKIHYHGQYLDGKTAARKPVDVHLSGTGLTVKTGGGDIFWPYSEIRQPESFGDSGPVRLERGGYISEVLLVDDPEFIVSLRAFAPSSTRHIKKPPTRSSRLGLTVFAAVAVLVLVAAGYLWGVPLLADTLTPFVPAAWEKALGESAFNTLVPEKIRVQDPEMNAAMGKIVSSLTAGRDTGPYRIEVAIARNPAVNAIALPGGKIIVFMGLIEKTATPEELAGVLAHEVQHILRRHSTKRIIEDSSTSLIIAALSGDVTGAMVYGAKGAHTIALLRYSRQDEDEADVEGTKMLIAAGIDPEAMARFLERLKKRGNLPEFLSTHPDLEERIKRIRQTGEDQGQKEYRSHLLTPREWDRLRSKTASQ